MRTILFVLACCTFLTSCSSPEDHHPYQDVTHFSKTFGHRKYYRLYLPGSYQQDNTTRFPVIYFFHGWGGRYKSDDNAKLAYDSLQRLVDKYKVMLVMWDGNVDEKEPRPYNIGSHNDVRYQEQMKDYFPELAHHIDSTYRTIADKQHRGIIGFSMGGFMSYFLAGKYPEMVRAAVGMTGSPEFFVGYPQNHTLYPLRYAFENLREVKLRFHNSTADELTYLNTEVAEGAAWDGKVSFEYWQFEGGHVVDLPGETRVFERAMSFVAKAFEEPFVTPAEWSHYDLYHEFSIYGYEVKTNKKRAGFTYLKHVSPGGFGIATRKWLPDGPPLDSVEIQLTTAPVYPPNARLNIVKVNRKTGKVSQSNGSADSNGRLALVFDGDYEVGISAPEDNEHAGAVAYDYEMKNGQRFLSPGDNQLQLLLFDQAVVRLKGDYKIVVTSPDSTLRISGPGIKMSKGIRISKSNAISIRCSMKPPADAAPPFVKLHVALTTGNVTRHSELVIPVMFDVPEFTTVEIDDNRSINDSTKARGDGNGDGIVQAGERIVVYVDGHPLKLYADSKFIRHEQEEEFDIMVPAKWPDGFTLASVAKVDDNCPSGTELELLGNFETKEYMPIKRTVHWGRVRIQVDKREKH
ncbi:alpha/beta fold hydrolase [Chryseolinea sp. T2]|uniref:alpha/beta hydrolase n=1 Tax=Chryseolinea sp. T2 TaxID=3129255 RepID=UPI003077E236